MNWKSKQQRLDYYRIWRENHREEIKEYQRIYRIRHHKRLLGYYRAYQKAHRRIRNVQTKFERAVKEGRIKRKPCCLCKKTAEAHHPDYNKVFEVAWLCKSHHRKLHLLLKRKSGENRLWTSILDYDNIEVGVEN